MGLLWFILLAVWLVPAVFVFVLLLRSMRAQAQRSEESAEQSNSLDASDRDPA